MEMARTELSSVHICSCSALVCRCSAWTVWVDLILSPGNCEQVKWPVYITDCRPLCQSIVRDPRSWQGQESQVFLQGHWWRVSSFCATLKGHSSYLLSASSPAFICSGVSSLPVWFLSESPRSFFTLPCHRY